MYLNAAPAFRERYLPWAENLITLHFITEFGCFVHVVPNRSDEDAEIKRMFEPMKQALSSKVELQILLHYVTELKKFRKQLKWCLAERWESFIPLLKEAVHQLVKKDLAAKERYITDEELRKLQECFTPRMWSQFCHLPISYWPVLLCGFMAARIPGNILHWGQHERTYKRQFQLEWPIYDALDGRNVPGTVLDATLMDGLEVLEKNLEAQQARDALNDYVERNRKEEEKVSSMVEPISQPINQQSNLASTPKTPKSSR